MNKVYQGLTPKQIKDAIYGKPKSHNNVAKVPTKKKKPISKSFRQPQNGDNASLLYLPFSTTQTAFLYPTPEWFTSTKQADVSIIIPIYNSKAEALVESWNFSGDGLKVEMIFVDDNCPANSKEKLVEEFAKRKTDIKGPIGKIYHSTLKQGWPACCNIGAEKATSDILVFLHPEVEVSKNWLKPIIRLLRKKENGLVGPIQINRGSNTFASAGAIWSWEEEKFLDIGKDVYNNKMLSKAFLKDNSPQDLFEARDCEKLSSHCMAVRKEDFILLGGFSPNLTYEEWADADFCMSAIAKGMKVICQGNSHVYCQQSPNMNDEKGRIYFQNKWITSGRIDSLVGGLRPSPIKEVKNIVLRRRAAHGDVLLAASVAPALKKKYPQAKILFSTDCPEILQNNPWIDKVIETYSERWFDLYYDLDMVYEYRPKENIVAAFADAVGVNQEDCDLFLDTQEVPNLPKDYVVIHAGRTLWAGRNWSTHKFDAISAMLKSAGQTIICVGTGTDHKTSICDLDLRNKTSISELGHVIMNAKIFIGIDSFPMHVAQTFEVPGVCFFGSINPETRLINRSIKPIIATGLKCLGCHHKKSTPCTSTTTCDVGIQDCINNVSIDQVWKAIANILNIG